MLLEDETFITQHKDFRLERTGTMRWDRVVESGDFILDEGMYSLRNAIILKILTVWGELYDNPTYNRWGDTAYRYLKQNKTPMTIFRIREAIRIALDEIRRIKEINVLNVTKNTSNLNKVDVYFKVTAHNDKTVEGGLSFVMG